MIAGPAYCAAADPVKTKMPAPMIAPIPKVTRLIGPSARFRLCSPDSPASFVSTSSDFVANKGLPMQLLLRWKIEFRVYLKSANLDVAYCRGDGRCALQQNFCLPLLSATTTDIPERQVRRWPDQATLSAFDKEAKQT